MGCIICNMLHEIEDEDPIIEERLTKELKEEICNDIAVCHPEMVTRINEICKSAASQDCA